MLSWQQNSINIQQEKRRIRLIKGSITLMNIDPKFFNKIQVDDEGLFNFMKGFLDI